MARRLASSTAEWRRGVAPALEVSGPGVGTAGVKAHGGQAAVCLDDFAVTLRFVDLLRRRPRCLVDVS